MNHHLLLADLALKDEGFGDLLPGAEAVILDEAHQVPDIAAQFFGQSWSVRQVQILLRDAAAEMSAAGRAGSRDARVRSRPSKSCSRTLRASLPGGAKRYEWTSLPDSFLDALPQLEAAIGDIAGAARGAGRRCGHGQLRTACRGSGGVARDPERHLG